MNGDSDTLWGDAAKYDKHTKAISGCLAVIRSGLAARDRHRAAVEKAHASLTAALIDGHIGVEELGALERRYAAAQAAEEELLLAIQALESTIFGGG